MAKEKLHIYCLAWFPVSFDFTVLFMLPPGWNSHAKRLDLQHKGNASAVVEPKREESLSFQVTIPR